MPPKEIKVPAEPPSGEGAVLTSSPEPELVNATEAGVRPIGDPRLLRTAFKGQRGATSTKVFSSGSWSAAPREGA